MSQAERRELQRAIEQKKFALVYYFHGVNEPMKDSAIGRLVDAAVDPATRDFNLDYIDGSEVTGESLGTLLNTPPLMVERRAVVVRDVLALRKEARQVLEQYIETPSPRLVLVLSGGVDVAKDALHDRLVREATSMAFDALEAREALAWVSEYARESLGVSITRDAADLLVTATEGEPLQLVAELGKVASYSGERQIDRDAVTAVVGVRHGETPGDLFDAVAARDAMRALALVPFILQQPKVTLVQVLMGLTTQMLAIAWGRAVWERGRATGALSGQFYNLLRETRAYPGRAWGDAVRVWIRAVPSWDRHQLDNALEVLLQADRSAKEGRYSSEEQLLSGVVLRLCGTGGGTA